MNHCCNSHVYEKYETKHIFHITLSFDGHSPYIAGVNCCDSIEVHVAIGLCHH